MAFRYSVMLFTGMLKTIISSFNRRIIHALYFLIKKKKQHLSKPTSSIKRSVQPHPAPHCPSYHPSVALADQDIYLIFSVLQKVLLKCLLLGSNTV